MIVRTPWRVATLVDSRDETPTARSLRLDVPGWPGHEAGQHLALRLTAPDGYRAQRDYSLAAPADGDHIEITVARVDDGEVSAHLTGTFAPGDALEVRGPVGGYFVWRPADPGPVLLVAGGSGIVPLMAMVRERRASGSTAPFRLVHSTREPAQSYYAAELGRAEEGLEVARIFTRVAAPGALHPPRRLRDDDLLAPGFLPADAPAVFVCGPTGFVEAVADLLVEIGHDPTAIRTERFG